MKQQSTLKPILLSAVAALGLATSAFAGGDQSGTTPAPDSLGLLGQTYAGLSYSYVHLDASPVSADRYGFEYNQPLNAGFDSNFTYDRTQDGLLAGDRAYSQTFTGTLRSFLTNQSWGKPYLEAGIGYDWQKVAGVDDHSFLWIAGAGIEFQATTALTVTPFVRYEQANGYTDNHRAEYGVKGNYWVTKQWALTAAVSRDDSQNMGYKAGVNFRF